MSVQYTNEPMLDMLIFETTQLIEQLEQSILNSEKSSCYTEDAINEIFRIMHTIKGSSAMMMFNNISTLAHSMEDLFYFLREEKPSNVDCSTLSDLLLEGVDFIKLEVEKLKNGDNADGDAAALIDRINKFLSVLRQGNNSTVSTKEIKVGQIDTKKQQYYISQSKVEASTYNNAYKAIIYFEDGCGMENIRAYSVIHNLKDFTDRKSVV